MVCIPRLALPKEFLNDNRPNDSKLTMLLQKTSFFSSAINNDANSIWQKFVRLDRFWSFYSKSKTSSLAQLSQRDRATAPQVSFGHIGRGYSADILYGGVKRPHPTIHSRHVYKTGVTSTILILFFFFFFFFFFCTMSFYVFLCSSDSISGPWVLLSLVLNK